MGCTCIRMDETVKMPLKEKTCMKLADRILIILKKEKMAQGLHLPVNTTIFKHIYCYM